MLQGLFTLAAIALRKLSQKPEKPIVILYGHQLSGNLKALHQRWLEEGRDEYDFYFMSLDPAYARTLKAAGVDVLCCASARDMLKLCVCSAIITDHSLHLMRPLVRWTDIRFIDVWHGIPFKGFTVSEFKLHHRYDEVWVSSTLLQSLYQDKFGFTPGIVHATGYARTDRLFRNSPPDRDVRSMMAIPERQKIVLYAPTWQQDDRGRALFPFDQGQESFIACLSEICNKHQASLILRSHLNASISTQSLPNVHYCSMREFPDTEDLLLQTDVLICDWSSISFDFLALARPALFLDVPPPFKNGFSLGKEYRFGEIVRDMSALQNALRNCLKDPRLFVSQHNDTYQRVTDAVYDSATDGTAASRQLGRLKNLLHHQAT